MNVIETKGLTKYYGKIRGIEIGPNGTIVIGTQAHSCWIGKIVKEKAT